MKSLLLPPGILLVLAVLGYVIRRGRPFLGKTLVGGSLFFLYAFSTPALSAALLNSLQWYEPLNVSSAEAQAAGIIVVLSGDRRRSDDGRKEDAGPLTLERLTHTARLKRALDLPILVTGGNLKPDRPALAEVTARVLEEDFGFRPDFLEASSHNTEFNARLTAQILKLNRVETIVLVTHAWHMPRAKTSFERHGLRVLPAPAAAVALGDGSSLDDWLPSAKALQGSSFALHEWIGLAWYWLRYDALSP